MFNGLSVGMHMDEIMKQDNDLTVIKSSINVSDFILHWKDGLNLSNGIINVFALSTPICLMT